jgi:hypothetical protein
MHAMFCVKLKKMTCQKINLQGCYKCSCDSLVGIMLSYRLDNQGSMV